MALRQLNIPVAASALSEATAPPRTAARQDTVARNRHRIPSLPAPLRFSAGRRGAIIAEAGLPGSEHRGLSRHELSRTGLRGSEIDRSSISIEPIARAMTLHLETFALPQ